MRPTVLPARTRNPQYPLPSSYGTLSCAGRTSESVMKRTTPLFAALLCVACHRVPESDLALTPGESVQGTYDYAAMIQGRQIRGFFTIANNDVVFTTRGA